MSHYPGIDYSGPNATCNRDEATGIRYGIIPVQDLRDGGGVFFESAEQDSGFPDEIIECPLCGNWIEGLTNPRWGDPVYCSNQECEHFTDTFFIEIPDCMECQGEFIKDDEYEMFTDESGDLWVTKSPYYTYAQFCSPCAPGACFLRNAPELPVEVENLEDKRKMIESNGFTKAFCLGHDWFDSDKAPYPVFSVTTNELVKPNDITQSL